MADTDTPAATRWLAACEKAELSRAEILRAVEKLAGEPTPRRTLDAWQSGFRPAPAIAIAFVEALALLPLAERKALGRARSKPRKPRGYTKF